MRFCAVPSAVPARCNTAAGEHVKVVVFSVIPAEAGIQSLRASDAPWIPRSSRGMTINS